MTSGRTVIHNPATPENMKRRQFILDSLAKSGLEWSEDIEENRITITYHGQPKQRTRTADRKPALPPPATLERCLRSRRDCDPDEQEYWDEMIRLSSEREHRTVSRIAIRTGHGADATTDTWAAMVSEHLAVNRGRECWTITHVQTGLAAGMASTFRDAIGIAQRVAEWPEWGTLRTPADVTPEFRRKAREAFGVAA